jgi:hypothetical protein
MTKRDAKPRAYWLKELKELMRDTSEEQFSAGWNHDLEFWIWADLHVDRWGATPLSLERRFLLARASAMLGGWLRWDDATRTVKFVPYDAWIVLYAAWKKKGKKR